MALKPDIWMPLYVDDWDSKTRHLTCEQDGAYGRLVRFYWKNGPLPDDNIQLRQIVGMDAATWRKARPILSRFFEIKSGCWFHDRVEEELTHARAVLEKRRESGAKGGRPKKQNESEPKPNGSENPPDSPSFQKAKGKQNETPARVEVSRSEGHPNPIQEDSSKGQLSQEEALGDGVVRFPGKSA